MGNPLEALSGRVIDSVRRIAESLRSENERIKRRVDLLAADRTADDLLLARIARLEQKADEDDPDRFAEVKICTPNFCAKVGMPCRSEFVVYGTDEYNIPFRRDCYTVHDVLIEMQTHWPANYKILADGNGDPALKTLVKP